MMQSKLKKYSLPFASYIWISKPTQSCNEINIVKVKKLSYITLIKQLHSGALHTVMNQYPNIK